jgi:hypothetical protein
MATAVSQRHVIAEETVTTHNGAGESESAE